MAYTAPTSEQMKTGIRTLQAIAETIRELGQIPAGTLYAQLIPAGMTLASFEQITGILTRAELIEERGNVLRWIGPQIEPVPTTPQAGA